jgi:6-phosphogluconolactonase
MYLTSLRRGTGLIWAPAFLLCVACALPATADEPEGGGSVYVMTNQATGNTIVVFHRDANGSLTKVQEVSTQGQGSGGSGDPLGSQGSLTLAEEGRVLLAANAGSNEVSLLSVTPDGLQFVGKAPSGGTKPVSVAARDDVAYVLNAGGTPNVTALRIGASGQLTTIASVPLPGGANSGPAQVGISPDGEVLVVTEKNTNQIDVFPIDDVQMAAGSSMPSDGATPFGFVFGRQRSLIVTEAAASTISSYAVGSEESHPTLQTITKSLPDMGAAACWIAIDRSRRLAFVVNSGTATISSLAVSPQGDLQLLVPAAANTGAGSAPIDLALTRNGGFLYVISARHGTLTGFRVENGTLGQVAFVSGLPLSIQGIAAR